VVHIHIARATTRVLVALELANSELRLRGYRVLALARARSLLGGVVPGVVTGMCTHACCMMIACFAKAKTLVFIRKNDTSLHLFLLTPACSGGPINDE